MEPLMSIFTWQFVLFSLAIAGVTYIMRLVVEYYKINVTHLNFWNNLVLPIFPLLLGSLMGWIIKMYPYPTGLNGNGSHILFGLVAGMFSGLAYRVLKSLILAKMSGNPDPDMIISPVPVVVMPTQSPIVVSSSTPTPVLEVSSANVVVPIKELLNVEPVVVNTLTTTTSEVVDQKVVDAIRDSIVQK